MQQLQPRQPLATPRQRQHYAGSPTMQYQQPPNNRPRMPVQNHHQYSQPGPRQPGPRQPYNVQHLRLSHPHGSDVHPQSLNEAQSSSTPEKQRQMEYGCQKQAEFYERSVNAVRPPVNPRQFSDHVMRPRYLPNQPSYLPPYQNHPHCNPQRFPQQRQPLPPCQQYAHPQSALQYPRNDSGFPQEQQVPPQHFHGAPRHQHNYRMSQKPFACAGSTSLSRPVNPEMYGPVGVAPEVVNQPQTGISTGLGTATIDLKPDNSKSSSFNLNPQAREFQHVPHTAPIYGGNRQPVSFPCVNPKVFPRSVPSVLPSIKVSTDDTTALKVTPNIDARSSGKPQDPRGVQYDTDPIKPWSRGDGPLNPYDNTNLTKNHPSGGSYYEGYPMNDPLPTQSVRSKTRNEYSDNLTNSTPDSRRYADQVSRNQQEMLVYQQSCGDMQHNKFIQDSTKLKNCNARDMENRNLLERGGTPDRSVHHSTPNKDIFKLNDPLPDHACIGASISGLVTKGDRGSHSFMERGNVSSSVQSISSYTIRHSPLELVTIHYAGTNSELKSFDMNVELVCSDGRVSGNKDILSSASLFCFRELLRDLPFISLTNVASHEASAIVQLVSTGEVVVMRRKLKQYKAVLDHLGVRGYYFSSEGDPESSTVDNADRNVYAASNSQPFIVLPRQNHLDKFDKLDPLVKCCMCGNTMLGTAFPSHFQEYHSLLSSPTECCGFKFVTRYDYVLHRKLNAHHIINDAELHIHVSKKSATGKESNLSKVKL